MALSEIDRNLIQRCLAQKPKAWNDFVDRYMGLVVHVVNHTARSRSIRLSTQDQDDLTADVFLAILENDFAVLRHFRGQASLATYLTVISRRVAVRELLKRKTAARLGEPAAGGTAVDAMADANPGPEQRLSDREEVERLLAELEGTEAEIVRLYHLDGKTYREISVALGMPENSIGPTLSRAREKLRKSSVEEPTN